VFTGEDRRHGAAEGVPDHYQGFYRQFTNCGKNYLRVVTRSAGRARQRRSAKTGQIERHGGDALSGE
jgi:hypothetical protein